MKFSNLSLLFFIMLNIISDKMKTIFEGQLTILPVSLVPQVADMDETVVRVIRSPLKSQQCHFGEQSDPGVLLGVQEMGPLMKLPEDFKKATNRKN